MQTFLWFISSTKLYFYVPVPPITVELDKNLEPPLVEGQTLIVTCRSNGSHPKAVIRWCIDGRPVTSKEVIRDGGNIVISYHKRKVTASDSGKSLECIVTNPSIDSHIIKRTYTMVVYCKYSRVYVFDFNEVGVLMLF